MQFFSEAVNVLQTLVIALGAGLAVWGVVNLLEGYGNDNPGAKSQGSKIFYTSITSLSHISKVTGYQAAYGRRRCRADWYFPHSFAVRIVLIGGQHF